MSPHKFKKGRFSRFFRLGSLSSIMGTSYLGHKLRTIGASPEEVEESLRRTNLKNAERLTKTFGELKGAVMKIGQMMSLQAGLFPEEYTGALSSLQQDSEPIDTEIIEQQISSELGAPVSKLFKDFQRKAFASASIGQVHRATLPDGTEVVVKVQYPGVAEMVESDMRNLRMLFKSLGKMKLNMDVMELWAEIRERMSEELDYTIEMENIYQFKELFKDEPRVHIPEPIPEYSTAHVLTMEYLQGLNWREVVSDAFPADLRNNLGTLLFETLCQQIFVFRVLHADPNLSNYGFRKDGSLVLYDFGCVKRFNREFIDNYRKMVAFAFEEEYDLVMKHVRQLGFSWTPDEWLDREKLMHLAQILLRPYLIKNPYDFSAATLHDEIIDFTTKHLNDRVKFTVPPDIIFLDRVVGGMYGNMMQLKVVADWRDLLLQYIHSEMR